MYWFFVSFKKYADFNGRACRKEYWFFMLPCILLMAAGIFVDELLGITDPNLGYGFFSSLASIFLVIPSLALTVRRLHDINRSGLWSVFSWVPCAIVLSITPNLIPVLLGMPIVLGAIALFTAESLFFWILLGVFDSNRGENDYGPNPKELYEEASLKAI